MANDVDYLYEPNGSQLHWDGLKKESPPIQQASLSGPAPSYAHPSDRSGMMGTSPAIPAAPQRTREPTPDELMAAAMAMVDKHTVQHQTQLSQGPATGNRNDSGGSVPAWLSREMERDTDL